MSTFRIKHKNVYVGSDFSQQEPRLLSSFANDTAMIDAYKHKRDLYATIAMKVYKNDYWDNMEHYEDGSPNPEGKVRRGSMKTLVLGILYGMGASNLGEKLNKPREEAQQIIDDFYASFPSVKSWIDNTKMQARKDGYVTDLWGRRRNLPDMLLPTFEVTNTKVSTGVNPLLFSKGEIKQSEDKDRLKILNDLKNARTFKDKEAIKESAKVKGYIVKDNGGFISASERECVNARIQGSAATMTKIAMRKLFDNKDLRDIGFKLVLQIHDEVIGEVREEYADKCADVLTSTMATAVADYDFIKTPFKCDADISPSWYYNDYFDTLKKDFNKLIREKSFTKTKAFAIIAKEHTEMCENVLRDNLM